MLAEDAAGEVLVGALWDIVEDWSSAAIQRTREAAATGSTDILDAEIRILIAHAAQLRGVIEAHLDGTDVVEPSARAATAAPAAGDVAGDEAGQEDRGEVLARIDEVPLAQVCPECFTMVRLDELDAHDQVCVRHGAIEKLDRMLEEEPQPAAPLQAVPDESEPHAAADEADDTDDADAADEDAADEDAADEDAQPDVDPDADAQVAPESDTAPEAPPAPDHTCNSADFERPLCDTCGGLHWYCSICGAQRDACRTAAAAG